MPVKLDLPAQTKKDKEKTKNAETARAENKSDSGKASSTASKPKASNAGKKAKRGQGRPKGDPVVTRSLRIKEDINDRLVKEQEITGLSYNELANRAFDAYLK